MVQWYTLDSGRLEITSGYHACAKPETTREGRLLHDWFTSKHRLISVVSSSPSQVVSPESAVSEELPRVNNNSCQWRHAHMQAGLVEHHDEKDSQQNPNDSQRPASVHQQAQRIPTVNITEATRSINQPPRRTHPQRPPCWQCVQPNPKPYRRQRPPALRFSIPTGHSVPRSFLSLWCVHSYGLWRRGTRYEAHGNSQTYGIWIQDKPCQQMHTLWETPWNCIMARS